VLSLVVSTIAFFIASYFLKRWADENEFPKGMTRSTFIFVLALAIAYGIAWLVDKLAGTTGL
jgi:membrane protein DedA with SNARE-associated domain